MNDDFYIGYLDEAPRLLARHTRRLLVMLAIVAAALAAMVAGVQNPAEPGLFEYGIKRNFEGTLHESPLPLLRSLSPDGSTTNYLLVGSGKHGLPRFARGHDGRRVRFDGTLIRKGPGVMIEMNDEKSFTVLEATAAGEPVPNNMDLGHVELTGELVDTKCYFGVMRPATGKVHRACAVRCLAGGVPPGLLLRDGNGDAVVVLLTGEAGKPPVFDVQWAARSVSATGTLTLRDGLPVLNATRIRLSTSPILSQ